MPLFLVFSVCVFASGFALRVIDPIVLPLAAHYAVPPEMAAMLNTAYALPYAVAQLFLGPLGDRFSKLRCMQVCCTGLTLALVLGLLAPSFAWLVATRIVAGIFAGGLIPLVLASLAEKYGMAERQVMIGRMLFAIIAGQMLGSVVSGLANEAFGWHSALVIAAVLGAVGAVFLWQAKPEASLAADPKGAALSFGALYGRVFQNPRAIWLYACALAEGTLFFSFFPYVGALLLDHTTVATASVSGRAGLILGAFGIGGLLYAILVRRLIGWLGVSRMCLIGSVVAAACYAGLTLSSFWWVDALTMLVAGFSFYMIHNSLQTQVTELAPSARGSAVALFACGLFAGQGIGPLFFGALMHSLGLTGALLLLSAGFVLLGQVVVRRVLVPAT
ncbi:MFS transporter [Polaromonas sp. SM01]|uniref:MFS transporter n=1 Tax=Polaromonas sp. SM01 TaxID=3085630 RepID=UPI0029822CD2|nr:MFS transporter [Polaromonas sp. SM01]MDW5441901.1 MFS transporter [Polaromonas sp. SM01]